jgi:hypothetical protein
MRIVGTEGGGIQGQTPSVVLPSFANWESIYEIDQPLDSLRHISANILRRLVMMNVSPRRPDLDAPLAIREYVLDSP